MKLRKLGNSELMVSPVGLGTWAIGGDYFGEVEEQRAIAAIQAALDSGINLVDTAPGYGQHSRAEQIVGKALKGRREQAVVCTKVGVQHEGDEYIHCLKRDSMFAELDASLARLGVDVIDLYQIHWPDPATPLEEALETLYQIGRSGKVRYLGVSNFTVEQLRQAMSIAGIVSCQPPYSLLDRASEQEILPFCQENGLGTLTYGSLSGGLLTGRYTQPLASEGSNKRSEFYPYFVEPGWSKCQGLLAALRQVAEAHGAAEAQVAIAWAIAQPGVTCALVGASRPEQAESNARAAELALSPADLQLLSGSMPQ